MNRVRLVLLLLAVVLGVVSCRVPQEEPAGRQPARGADREPPPRLAEVREEPEVRVRVGAGVTRVVLGGAGLTVGPSAAQAHLAQAYRFEAPLVVTRQGGQFVLEDGAGQAVQWALASLRVETASQRLGVDGRMYPGAIELHPAGDRIHVVNHVPMEQYLPGVLERELFGSWHVEAFVAQAIAARSYAIAYQRRRGDRPWELEATVASQVYGGEATNPKAIEAVRRTRGQVLTWAGRVVPAYFSSNSGGVSQDAPAAFPTHGPHIHIPPLMGHAHGWGVSSNHFQWGPVVRDRADVSRRLAAWGRQEKHAIAGLGLIVSIQPAATNAGGRPTRYRVTDDRAQVFEIGPEGLRFGSSFEGGGLGPVEAALKLKSGFLEAQVRGGQITFRGRGHGHGVGMDQWAAQEMAKAGHRGEAIVEFFYPGARVERVY